MCCDEFGTLFSVRNRNDGKSKNIDHDFLNWICDRMTTVFYTNFFIDKLPNDTEIEMSYQYCLNIAEENENTEDDVLEIAVDIGSRAFNRTIDAHESNLILPSLFNLVRILQVRLKGNLVGINAVPGIAILLPKCMENESKVFEFIEENDEDNVNKIIDIHFYLANWFREIISAFASQDHAMIRKKVLTRLSHLIAIETRITALLRVAAKCYKPPNCLFVLNEIGDTKFKKPTAPSFSQKAAASKKKVRAGKSSSTQANQTRTGDGMSLIANTMRTQNTSIMNAIEKFGKSGQKYNIYYEHNEIYRPMDPDIMLLLKEDLVLNAELDEDMIGNKLGLRELKFIIGDLIMKIESLSKIRTETISKFNYAFAPADIISDLIQFFPNLLEFIKQFIDFINLTNEKEPNDMFKENSNYVKICYALCLRLLSSIYQWSDMKKHENMVRESFHILAGLSEIDSKIDIKEIAMKALKSILEYENSIQDMQSAVYLFQLASGIAEYTESDEGNQLVVSLCTKFLSKRWFAYEGGEEKGAHCNLMLDKLLRGLFKDAKLPMIRSTAKWVTSEIINLKKKNGCLRKFPLIQK